MIIPLSVLRNIPLGSELNIPLSLTDLLWLCVRDRRLYFVVCILYVSKVSISPLRKHILLLLLLQEKWRPKQSFICWRKCESRQTEWTGRSCSKNTPKHSNQYLNQLSVPLRERFIQCNERICFPGTLNCAARSGYSPISSDRTKNTTTTTTTTLPTRVY